MRNYPIKILLVDDDEITNYLSSEILQQQFSNAEISIATNGEEAMKYLFGNLKHKQPLPDIMLVDINMPHMDGWEFIEILDAHNAEEFRAVNIFMYTSSEYFEDINRGKSHRMLKNILTKPLTDNDIKEIVHATDLAKGVAINNA